MRGWILLLIFLWGWFSGPGLRAQGCWEGRKVRITGWVREWRPPLLVVETPEGETFYLRLGPYRFWRKWERSLRPGLKIWIQGWRCGDMLIPEVLKSRHLQLRLRDEQGWPLWRRPCPWEKRRFRRWRRRWW
ncbi:MAG TPA: hypothetical protein ENJ40_00660 [Thermosulfurimonas dismutans]|uniref:DUF5666 domain-containing protein n=1 Tax=Thermosulfurimonas dismutans TaxID=999894 RepID=A0A7C3CJG9_9BACT|nr:hypothetical protein [Thermosulfurimonas dismutans]